MNKLKERKNKFYPPDTPDGFFFLGEIGWVFEFMALGFAWKHMSCFCEAKKEYIDSMVTYGLKKEFSVCDWCGLRPWFEDLFMSENAALAIAEWNDIYYRGIENS